MNSYHRFLFSLLTEFRRGAERQIQCLRLELMKLEGASNEDVRSAVLHQALRRIHLLGWAAGATSAHQVQVLSQTLEFMLIDLTHTGAPARPQSFEAIRQPGVYWLEMNEPPPRRGGAG